MNTHEQHRVDGDGIEVTGNGSIEPRPDGQDQDQEKESPLLKVSNLCVEFQISRANVEVLHKVDLQVRKGETLCLVGESGCGKSVTSLAIMGLVRSPPGRVTSGEVLFDGIDLYRLPPKEYQRLRGSRMGMVFQEPGAALDPLFTVEDQIGEPLRVHRGYTKKQARQRVLELLATVGIPAPEERLGDYPHLLSGGMKQRVVISAALACDPDLLIADEPTTALDVTVQAQILRLLDSAKQKRGLAMVFITHDLGVVAQVADRVAVLYSGYVVEEAPVGLLFKSPAHPYTEGLMKSLPKIPQNPIAAGDRLYAISGTVPKLGSEMQGCAFASRCPKVERECLTAIPELKKIGAGHKVRCHLVKGGGVEG